MRLKISSWWNRLPESLRFVLPIWLGMRLLSTIIGIGVWKIRPLPPAIGMQFYRGVEPVVQGLGGMFLGVWQRWDSIYYQIIAEQGYTTDNVTVFFPLYPLTTRLLSRLTGLGLLESLYVISTLAYLIAFILLYALLADTFDTAIARRGVLALAVFPSSFFLFALYPHGMELALILASVWLARKRRWLGCALTALLAGLTHSTALPLALILLVEAVRFIRQQSHPWRWAVLGVAGMPALGIGLFWAWRIVQGFPPIPEIIAREFLRYPAPPWENIIRWLALLPQNLLSPDWLTNSMALILVIATLIWGIKRLPAEWLWYQFFLLIMVLGIGVHNDPLLSFNRYILVSFPLFAALGWWANTPAKRLIGFAVGVSWQMALLTMFMLWLFIG